MSLKKPILPILFYLLALVNHCISYFLPAFNFHLTYAINELSVNPEDNVAKKANFIYLILFISPGKTLHQIFLFAFNFLPTYAKNELSVNLQDNGKFEPRLTRDLANFLCYKKSFVLN